MNKKRGFTLIELLAVIVILAIIAVIAVPIVLNIIDETKNNAGLRSAEMYVKAAELSIANSTLKDIDIPDGEYSLKDGDICLDNGCTKKLEVEVNGEVPESGTITITNGNISNLNIVLNEKTIVKNSDGELVYQSEENNLPKVCTIERQVEDKYSVGDVITCELSEGIDKFYVIEEQPLTASKIQMLTEKNVHTTEYRQSDNAGTVDFSTTNYWESTDYPADIYNENSLLYPIVEGYVSYLNEKLTGATGSLLTYNQSKNLGYCYYSDTYCPDGDRPSWLYTLVSYWLGTAYDRESVFANEYSDPGYQLNTPNFNPEYLYYGVRPVITIKTGNLK